MMKRPILAAVAAIGSIVGASALAADDVAMGRDLKATIVLQGKPCDEILNSKRNGDSDYTATCKDGNRYHVYVSAQGRVVVDKL